MAQSVWLLTGALPRPSVADAAAERLAYALRAHLFAIVPPFVMFITIGNKRFLSDAIGSATGSTRSTGRRGCPPLRT